MAGELGWNWSLSGGGGGGVTTSSVSGLDILSQLVNGGNKTSGSYATTQATGNPSEFNQGGGQQQQQGGSRLDPVNNPPHDQPDIGADIWIGGGGQGGGDVDSDPGVGFNFRNINNGFLNTGFMPNLSGQDVPAARSGGGGGGGGGAITTASGQKLIFNDRNGTWSLQDPATKKWEDNIATSAIYGRLTGDIKDANPEWYYGQAANSAMDNRQADLYRMGTQYSQRQAAGNQIFRYPNYGL